MPKARFTPVSDPKCVAFPSKTDAKQLLGRFNGQEHPYLPAAARQRLAEWANAELAKARAAISWPKKRSQ